MNTLGTRVFISALVGGSVAALLMLHDVVSGATASGQVMLIGAGAAAAAVAFVLFTLTLRDMQRYGASVGPRVALSLLIGLALALIISPYILRARTTVRITATGERNKSAKGSEVWLTRMRLPDGSCVWPPAFNIVNGWESDSATIKSYRGQPAVIEWIGDIPTARAFDANASGLSLAPSSGAWDDEPPVNIRFEFVSHPWSGVVEVEAAGSRAVVDLYSMTNGTKTVVLPLDAATLRAMTSRWPSIICGVAEMICFALLAFTVGRAVFCWAGAQLRRTTRVQRCVVVGAVAASTVVVSYAWPRGLGNVSHSPGVLRLEAEVQGADILPIALDEGGREIVDIQLNRYEHHGRCRILPKDGVTPRVAVIGVVDDRARMHFAREFNFGRLVEALPIQDCAYRGVWIGGDDPAEFSFSETYDFANLVLHLPPGVNHARAEIEIDGVARTVELRPVLRCRVAHVSVEATTRPSGLIAYEVELPAVHLQRLTAAPLEGTRLCRIGGVRLETPEVVTAATTLTPENSVTTSAPIVLADHIRYHWRRRVIVALFFVGCTAMGAVALLLAFSLAGRPGTSAVLETPTRRWERMAVIACVALGLWLQSAACGWYSADSRAYVSRALTLFEEGHDDYDVAVQPIGFPLFVEGVIALGGDGQTIWALNSVLLAAAILVAWRCGRALGGRVGGLLAALFIAVNPILLISSRYLLPDFLFTAVFIFWLYVLLRWLRSEPARCWPWVVAGAAGWLTLVLLRPNALTLLPAGLIVPFLQRGRLPWRAAGAAAYVCLAYGSFHEINANATPSQMGSWGRMFPVLHHNFAATDCAEFRPVRRDYVESYARIGGLERSRRLFYDRIYAPERCEASSRTIKAVVNASIRRSPRAARHAATEAATYCYVTSSLGHLYGLPRGIFSTREKYERAFTSHLHSDDRHHEGTTPFLGTLATDHREGAILWPVFLKLHELSREHRLWPMSILALIGVVYALLKRDGALLLPGILNALFAWPLCALFMWYDRYFMPGEPLLALQAAVGVRAIAAAARVVFQRVRARKSELPASTAERAASVEELVGATSETM